MTTTQRMLRHYEHLAAEALRSGNVPRYAHYANLADKLRMHLRGLRHPQYAAEVERLA